jgi:hypothetical protein
VLASDRGSELYRKRQPMIEPVFAQMSRTGFRGDRVSWFPIFMGGSSRRSRRVLGP